MSVDVFLVVNQVTGLAESRTQDGLTEFFFFQVFPGDILVHTIIPYMGHTVSYRVDILPID